MLWWFEKDGSYVRCEVLDLGDRGYELHILMPDGTERVEHFTDAKQVARRQDAVNLEFRAAGWNGPHGWRI